jgi:hypothetical protein
MSEGQRPTEDARPASDRETLVALDGVDEASAERLADADVTARDLRDRRVSYRDLLGAGVAPERAARLRREHALQWSFEAGDDDLAERSASLRGLEAEERAWIEASAGDWEDRLGTRPVGEDDDASRDDGPEWTPPTPVTAIPGIDEEYAERLAEGGVVSVRTLAVADPVKVATALGMEPNRVTSWHWRAREETDSMDLLRE